MYPGLHVFAGLCLALSAEPVLGLVLSGSEGKLSRQVSRSGVVRVRLQRRPGAGLQPGVAFQRSAGLALMQVQGREGSERPSSAVSEIVPASGAPLVDIFGQIRVGTPPQFFSVAIDTGSSNLLLTSSSCRSIGCLAHKGYSLEASSSGERLPVKDSLVMTTARIATGQVAGEPVVDEVCLGIEGDMCTRSAFLRMTKMTQEPFNVFPYDGILGVGMPSQVGGERFNLLTNLAKDGRVKRNLFSVWLASEADSEDSEIVFGDVPQERLASEILWMPTIRPRQGHNKTINIWRTHLRDVAVNNKLIGVCGTIGCQAGFDTGTSVIAGADTVIQGIISALNVQEDCSNYQSLPTLGFAFKSHILNIEKRDYVKKVGSPARCFHQFLSIEAMDGSKPLLLLGDPFLRRFFTVYDLESLTVGVAVSNHRAVPGDLETHEHRAARLMVQAV